MMKVLRPTKLMAAAALLYFGALWAAGLKLRQLLRR